MQRLSTIVAALALSCFCAAISLAARADDDATTAKKIPHTFPAW